MQEWTVTLLSLATSTIVTSIIGYMIKRGFDKYFQKKEEESKKTQKRLEDAGKIVDANRERQLKEVIGNEVKTQNALIVKEFKTQITELDSKITDIDKKVNNIKDTADLTADASRCLLRDKILQSYYACLNKGYKTSKEDENINHLYEAYKSLNGNSYVEECYETLKKLPVQEAPTALTTLSHKKGHKKDR